MNETCNLLWEMTNEELVKVQIFYTAIKKDLIDLEVGANSLITVHREVLNFDWLDDTAFNEWKDKFMFVEKLVQGDEAKDDVEVTITLTIDDEDKENPHIKVILQVIEDDSSLSSLKTTYSKNLE